MPRTPNSYQRRQRMAHDEEGVIGPHPGEWMRGDSKPDGDPPPIPRKKDKRNLSDYEPTIRNAVAAIDRQLRRGRKGS